MDIIVSVKLSMLKTIFLLFTKYATFQHLSSLPIIIKYDVEPPNSGLAPLPF
jgi:hypothetical protein